MKTKIGPILVAVLIANVAIVASAFKDEETTSNKLQNNTTTLARKKDFTQEIEDIAQENFNHSKDSIEAKQILSEKKLRELEGHINKEYGIREDILRFIEKEIPADNVKAKRALVRLIEKSNFIYYHASQNEAIRAIRYELLALHCFTNAFSSGDYNRVLDEINKLMRNTPERDAHMWDIDKRYFGWKVLGFGNLSDRQIKEICEKEAY